MKFEKHVLENGLRVVLAPMEETQTVTVQILVEAGSKYENKGNNGISHFLEHMIFKGTKKRPDTKTIAEELDSVGGAYNAFTSKERTGYWVKVPSKYTDKALDVVSDMYLNSLLNAKEIEKERGVILQEKAMYQDTPMRHVWDVFEELLYGDQAAGWDIIGTEKNIKELQRDDFVNYVKDMYTPSSTVFIVAGNFDKKRVLKQITNIFGALEKREKIDKKKTLEDQKEPALKVFYKDTEQTHLLLGVRSPDMFSEDRYAALILGTLLGGGMSSRTFINIREKEGLTYYIDSGIEMSTDTGYLYVCAGVEHRKLKKTISLIIKELNEIIGGEITEKELLKAKEYLKGKMLMSLESSSAVASFLGEQELFRHELKEPKELFKKIDSISIEDVKAIAGKVFKNNVLNLAIIGPHKNEENLKKLLKF